jgi:hypothetical protein
MMAEALGINDLPWRPIHEAPHDKWLLVRGSSGRRDGIKRYASARYESDRTCDWTRRFRDQDGNAVTDSGPMPSEFVEI